MTERTAEWIALNDLIVEHMNDKNITFLSAPEISDLVIGAGWVRSGPVAHLHLRSVTPFLSWYEATAYDDATMVWTKAKEYGGFTIQARAMADLFGVREPDERLNMERIIAVNAAQKLARISESLGRGQFPSVDSWRDLSCYSMIARRARETKTWPA